jgi:predicted alpha/beta-hydrolase family hydrolase
MINQVRHDIHPSAVVGGLTRINLLQDLANEVQEFLSMIFATSARIRLVVL